MNVFIIPDWTHCKVAQPLGNCIICNQPVSVTTTNIVFKVK